jgi:polysaccharide pyruvyl transferase WcaK-like protein
MRILVEPGSYTCMNMGDVAMMQVCVSRLAELWPGAHIQVVTQAPERLASFCPNAQPILESGKEYWFQDKIFGRFQNYLSSDLRLGVQATETALRRRFPLAVGSLFAAKRRTTHRDSAGISNFLKAVLHADLVVASGTGMVNDEFRDRALQMLSTLGMANQHGIPTAMVSQGIGPVSDNGLLASLKAVLPNVRVVTLRERLLGPTILKQVGYPSNRALMAGDDALQLAFANRTDALGDAIGVNLRMATYSQVDLKIVNAVRHALETAASELRTSYIPVAILYRDDSDLKATAALISGYEDQSFGAPVMTPLDVMRRIGHCRLVVTGSYHGAVFALGQGIPAVALAKSPYYLGKFQGLKEQFGQGCQLINWSGDPSSEDLIAAIRRAWSAAPQLRPTLLKTAQEQIRSTDNAYRTLHSCVS